MTEALSERDNGHSLIRAAIYARVSNMDNGQDPTRQTRELREYCQWRGWQLVGEYVDSDVLGTKEKRRELDRLMADAQEGRFDAIVIWKFNRFARSVSHLARALETFNSLGIAFVSLLERIDTTTPEGKAILSVLDVVAGLERSLGAERVRVGMINARANGKKLGRPRANVDIAKIAALRAEGLSWPAVAGQLRVGVATAYGAFQRLSRNADEKRSETG